MMLHPIARRALFRNGPISPSATGWRSFHSTVVLREGVWKRFLNLVGSALASDDKINPKKILERRYLYFALTALRYKQLLEDFPESDADDLKVKAVEDLHKRQVDEKSNLELRAEMQKMIAPQALDIFIGFDSVDKTLNLNGDAESSEEFFGSLDWDSLKDILGQEEEETNNKMERAKRSSQISSEASRSLQFFNIKLGALQTLLHFHQLRTTPPDFPSDGVDYFGMELGSLKEDNRRTRTIRKYQTVNLCRSALIRESVGYSVLCLRSTIEGGGRGAFIDGQGATTGSLVAFQPGDVWPKEHLLTNAPDVIAHFDSDEDCQTSLRFDEYVLDSRTSPVTILTRDGSMNPWALGHMVNHPAPGLMPNCQSLMFDFTEKMSLRDLLRYVPNVYARPPGWQSRAFDQEPVAMHSMCLLARRDIKNEELFYDYRLQSNETPSWYEPVSYGDDFLDKEQVVFFRDDWKNK
eukprot:scaffold2633_cov156-Amphora_coffeaeformis.AAC.17